MRTKQSKKLRKWSNDWQVSTIIGEEIDNRENKIIDNKRYLQYPLYNSLGQMAG